MSTFNCSDVPTETATDAGVAGAGVCTTYPLSHSITNKPQVLLSFIITATISLLFSSIIILVPCSPNAPNTTLKILRKLLLSLSDQQLITGIGLQSIGLSKMKSMVPYHFFIIFLLSLLSTAVHISTLFALIEDFKRDWVLRWLRQFFMFVNLVLSCVSGVFVLMTTLRNLEPTLPIACVWVAESRGAASNSTISIFGTIAVIVGQVGIFVVAVWYLHVNGGKWIKVVQIGGLVALLGMGTAAAVRVVGLSQAFGTPSVKLVDEGEKEWNFGQLLSLLLLVLPCISAVEILRGEFSSFLSSLFLSVFWGYWDLTDRM
jgi:hypothetical protein